MRLKTFKEGFTLIELSLSMAFIGVLSVAIVIIISNTISSYRRGLTLNQINTTGMDIVDDMRTAIQNASSKSVLNDCLRYYGNDSFYRAQCISDGGFGFVSYTKNSRVTLYAGKANQKSFEAPIYGVFCTGAYTYIWNTGYYNVVGSGAEDYASFSEKTAKKWAQLTYTNANDQKVTIVGSLSEAYNKTTGQLEIGADGKVGNPDKPFRLLKVPDRERAICTAVARNSSNGNGYSIPNNDNLTNEFVIDVSEFGKMAADEEPVDLILEDANNDLAIYSLSVAEPAESATRKNSFYAASFILGTIRGGVDIVAQGKNCQVPTDYENEEFDYCAINRFSFAVQAGGE